MPRYFLHITEGDEVIHDLEGIERPDLDAVERAAMDGVSDLIADAVKRGDRDYQGRLDVEDEQGREVLSLTFACPVRIEPTPACPKTIRPQTWPDEGRPC